MEMESLLAALDNATETRKLALGGLVLFVSTALVLGVATIDTVIPSVSGAIAALGMAAGALLVGLSEDGASV